MPFPSNMLFPKLLQVVFTNFNVCYTMNPAMENVKEIFWVQQKKIGPFSKCLLMKLLRQTFLVLNFI